MKGIVFRGKGVVETAQVDTPTIVQPDDAIIEVVVAGLCGSDLHPYLEREKGLAHGTVMGHEVLGIVHQIGSGVKTITCGDIVAVPFTTNCGDCFYCKCNLPCRCVKGQLFGWVQDGAGIHGAQSEFVRVPLADSSCVAIRDDSLRVESALLVGDILATGYHCFTNSLQPEHTTTAQDGTYVVVGCGPVGLCAIASAHASGITQERLFAVDMIDERLECARSLGATPLKLDRTDPDTVLSAIRNASASGDGAEGSMECVGHDSAVRLAFQAVRPGGIVSSIGVNTDETLPFGPVAAYDKNVTFRSGRCPVRRYMTGLLQTLGEKDSSGVTLSSRLNTMITHRFPLTSGQHAYTLFEKKLDKCIKCVFYCGRFEGLMEKEPAVWTIGELRALAKQ